MTNQPKWVPTLPKNKFLVREDRLAHLKQTYSCILDSKSRARYWLALCSLISEKGTFQIRAHRAAWFCIPELNYDWSADSDKKLQLNYEIWAQAQVRLGRSGSGGKALQAWLIKHNLPGTVWPDYIDGQDYWSVSVSVPELTRIREESTSLSTGMNLFDFRSTTLKPFSKPAPSEPNGLIASVIAKASNRLYSPALSFDEAAQAILAHYKNSPESAEQVILAVKNLYSDGFRPEYNSVEECKTARVFAVGVSIQIIPSWLKKQLFPSWRELDLKSAWAKIASSIVGVELPDDIWSDVESSYLSLIEKKRAPGHPPATPGLTTLNQSPLNLTPEPFHSNSASNSERLSGRPPPTKQELKPLLYSMICGKSLSMIKGELTKTYGKEISDCITGVKWFKEIGEGCDKWRSTYEETHQVTSEESRRQMALLLQKIEQDIIQEVYVVSQRYSRVQIVSAEHDGCSVVCSNENDWRSFYRAAVEAVSAKAESLSITGMRLEEKAPQLAESNMSSSSESSESDINWDIDEALNAL